MVEQPRKKSDSIMVKRVRAVPPKFVVTTGFKLRVDKSTGLIEFLLEASGQKGERVIFDPVLIQNNHEHLKQFIAAVPVDPDEKAQKEEVSTAEQVNFCNVIHLSRVGNRAETIFGVFSLSDWVSESQQATRTTGEITSYDAVVAVSTSSLQKKLVLELVLLFNQLNKTK
ncbi:MAG TPA: hypothetical protein VG077_07770 [Verrucomicrobiae bacterium]|nr:hypothetical protein [Verrucomicrobiae bacterium]HEV2435880.1 hypothetical protein [Verrucomicrobiae bacterium]